MPPRHRPSAFEVSFGIQLPDSSADHSNSAQGLSQKRRADEHHWTPPPKRQVPALKAAFFEPRQDEPLKNEEELVLLLAEDADGGEEDKPVRILNGFSVFDPKHHMEMISLKKMEEDDRVDRQFEAAGYVTAYGLMDEDEGQDDELYVRLGAILRYTIDCGKENDPVWIETTHAWYMLQAPSPTYEPFFREFCVPYRVAQLTFARARAHPVESYNDFRGYLINNVTILGRSVTEDDIRNAIPEVQEALNDAANKDMLIRTPIIKHFLPHSTSRQRTRRSAPVRRPSRLNACLFGNLDIAVLRPENQTVTTVTPTIAKLAGSYFNEYLKIVGPPLQLPTKEEVAAEKKKAHKRLCNTVARAHKTLERKIDYPKEAWLKSRSIWLKAVKIGDRVFEVGDVVLVRIGKYRSSKPAPLPDVPQIPPESMIADYFWFAKIIYLNAENKKAHVQWFEHSSRTALQELANPQQLFLTNLCDPISFHMLIEKVTVHFCPEAPILAEDFYYNSIYDEATGDSVDVNVEAQKTASLNEPPENCYVCLLKEQESLANEYNALPEGDGLVYNGHTIHLSDFILIRTLDGPARIGYIEAIQFPARDSRLQLPMIVIRPVGRISDLKEVLPPDEIRDEKHVYLTEEEETIRLHEVLRVCYVFVHGNSQEFTDFISLSPDHFYVRYRFPKLSVDSWASRRAVHHEDLAVCPHCCGEQLRRRKGVVAYLESMREQPIQTLDLFGGVGAFSLGIDEGSGCTKVTHTIEIMPSAAKTFKHNSPDTVVYNQCVNVILRYFIKSDSGHNVEIPCQLYDQHNPVPPPLKPGDIQNLVAGFPCQSHSGLNMFRKANDTKSNLILTTLAYVDFLKPDRCFFENVKGFLQYSLGATQAGPHRLEGGIEMGGLKFLLRCLSELGYQWRFSLIQAGHYGLPQTRVRFFLVAARRGVTLPPLPQPSHFFPLSESLAIKLPVGHIINAIRPPIGNAPLPFVSIDDAISDLPRFDWKNPQQHTMTAIERMQDQERRRNGFPAISCDKRLPYCGYDGEPEYYHDPKTTYQVRSRERPSSDIQHYTITLLPQTVERVVNIPLIAKADYRSLKAQHHEWQFSNPVASVPRDGYRSGLYGRLDKDEWFSTTVTNMHPTAKQSRVLHPYCKRMVTVRELARSQGFPDWFKFITINKSVATMHRQIGNAVPWPVACVLGRELRNTLVEEWLARKSETMDIDD